ncbi:hypothetical protein BGX26_008247 [Mortierella sp. AD094]|nr:hypothetical protein BGX26_008247 [Mortierella sp. AD094]
MAPKSSVARKRASAAAVKPVVDNAQNLEGQNLISKPAPLLVTPIPTSTDGGSTSMSETSVTSSTSTCSTSADKALPASISNPRGRVYDNSDEQTECLESPTRQAQDSQRGSKKMKKKKTRKDAANSKSNENIATVQSPTNEEPIPSISILASAIETQGNSACDDKDDKHKLIGSARKLVIIDHPKLEKETSPKQAILDETKEELYNTNNNDNNSETDGPVTLLKAPGQEELLKTLNLTTLDEKMMVPESNDTDWGNPSPNIKKHDALFLDAEKEKSFEQQDIVPGMQPRNRQQNRQQQKPRIVITESEVSRLGENGLFQEGESDAGMGLKGHMTKLRALEDASEKVVRNTIKCLVKDNDMELSYISILSAINVLNSKHDQESDKLPTVPSHIRKMHQSIRKEARDKIGKLYSKLLKVMTRSGIVEALSKDSLRQGAVTPEALYLKLYDAIQDAGYNLQDQDHLHMCQFLLDHQGTEDALVCLNKIDSGRWNSPIYRASITCHLFSKPRHLHEAEIVLYRYLDHIKAPLLDLLNSNKPNANSILEQSYREKERSNRIMIRKWFKLQQDASKWEEIKAQYERRRTRLLDAPEKIERFSAVALIDYEQNSIGGVSIFPRLDNRRGSTASSISTTSSAFAIPQVEITTAATQQSQSNSPEPTPTPAPISSIISPFSFFSSLMSSQRRSSTPGSTSSSSANTTASSNSTVKNSPTQAQPQNLLYQSNASCNKYQISRYLTALDNGMLEECINHKQFKYGWEHVYERMGPALEDKDTAKIAMRLCKRAFLGHGGLGPNQPGSPNIQAKDMCFEDEFPTQDDDGDDGDDDDDDESKEWKRIEEKLKEKVSGKRAITPAIKKVKQEDPEIWEARAWVIYNKAMMSPLFFGSNSGSPTGSPIQLQQPPSSTAASTRYHRGNGTNHASSMSLASAPPSVTAIVTGASSLTVFLHNILTVAINSPEKSSRFLKAFRIYSAMRNDPLNQYQAQLRDPFVMTCMIKAIYDTVLTILRAQKQQQHQSEKQEHQEYDGPRPIHLSDPEPSTRGATKLQTMTIGPLIDLAFEIYADMRNVGPIRYLPQLSALAPTSPTSSTPGIPTANSSNGGSSGTAISSGISSSMSIFFQLASRPPVSSSSTVDLSACGANALLTQTASKPSLPTSIFTRASAGSTGTISSTTPATATTTAIPPCILQELNPTLSPNIQARRLPSELYLALLHLCVQVPLSGIQQSFRVVKAITTDMMSIKSGQQPANLDRHLAAALQFYHDQWMCRPLELKERRGSRGSSCCNSSKTAHQQEVDEMTGGCIFHEWMYRSDEYVKYMSASNTSSDGALVSDLSDTSAVVAPVPATFAKSSFTSAAEEKPLPYDTAANAVAVQEGNSVETAWEESPHYSILKHDADLDELDQYLRARAAVTGMSRVRASGHEVPDDPNAMANNNWMDGFDHDTCNDRFYWDLWNREDPVLQNIRFSRRRARMLWRHVENLEDM